MAPPAIPAKYSGISTIRTLAVVHTAVGRRDNGGTLDTSWLWLGAGAVGGWLVSQTGNLVGDIGRRWLLKRSIVSELNQVYEETERIWLICARSLQIYTLGGIDDHQPLPISSRVFASHYADAALILTRVQRKSLELIHTYVDEVNRQIEATKKAVEAIHDAKADGRPIKPYCIRYGSSLVALMRTSAQARWSARYYLQRPDFPVIENDSEEMEGYRKYVDAVSAEIASIEASVTGLTLEDFRRAAPIKARAPVVGP